MKLSLAALAWVTAIAVAGPLKQSTSSTIQRRFSLDIVPFDELVCKAAETSKLSLGFLFPPANYFGKLVFGPALKVLIGEENLEYLDVLADDLGVSVISTKLKIRVLTYCRSTSGESGDLGLPQKILGVGYAFSKAENPLGQAKLYKCLVNLLCL
jgi:hypothetical protein